MKKFFLFIILSFMLYSSEAQIALPLYKTENITGKIEAVKEEYFLSPEGFPLVKNISVPGITVYLPVGLQAKVPAVIIFPGGGYGVIAYKHEGHDVAMELAKQGIAGIVVKYRLPNELNRKHAKLIPLQDAQQAISIVRRSSKKWNLDSDKIGVMGFSAGGHLAATAATHYKDQQIRNKSKSLRPDYLVLVYPVISFSEIGHSGSRENLLGNNATAADLHYFSNELHVDEQTPPTFLVHAEDDGGVPVENSIRFKKVLEKNGVKNQLFLFNKGGHGFGLINNSEPGRIWLNEVVAWIKNL